MQPITSFQNPRVKSLRSLRHRKYRHRESRFLIEGIRIVEEALSCEAAVETLVYAPDLLVSQRAQALVERVDSGDHLVVSGEIFRTLSDRDTPQGIAAVVRIEDRSLATIPPSEEMLFVVAYQLGDPGNLGAIIRTAEAAGATGLLIVEPSVDLYDPQTVRATMGSLFALPIVRLADAASLAPWYAQIRATGLPLLVVASSAHGPKLLYEVDLRGPVVLLIGSERYGLPASIRDGADEVVRLPMAGRATSLNASAAAAALIYEVIRQRQAGDGGAARSLNPAPKPSGHE